MRCAQAARFLFLLLAWDLPGAAMAEWKLEREEDFRRASALDASFWALETGYVRNQEAQYYTPANVTLGQGFLRIEARREQVANAAWQAGARGWRNAQRLSRYTSGSMVSRAPFHYGRFEVVARSPGGAGVWPAIWLVHESAEQYGEIDFYESVGKHPDTAFAAVHFGRRPDTRDFRSFNRQVPGLEGGWHTHTLEWTPQRITASVNGQVLMVFDPAQAATGGIDPLRRPMRLHINLALGGTWGGPIDDSRLPARFDIASVRIWSWQPGAGAGAGAAAEAPIATPRWGR